MRNDYLIIETKHKNNYLYSYNKNSIIYITKSLSNIISKKDNKKIICNTNDISLYNLLLENGYFDKINILHNIRKEICENDIKMNIHNIKNVVFELTESCNLSCKYCGYGKLYNNKRNGYQLEFENIKTLIDFINEKHQKSSHSKHHPLNFGFYGGEPLLKAEIIKKTIAYIDSLKWERSITYSMTTNGVLIDKNIDLIVENKIQLLISLDGNGFNNGYRTYHSGKESHTIVQKNIDLLKEKSPLYFEKYVNFNAVLHNKNCATDIFNYFMNRYNKTPQISPLSQVNINKNYELLFQKMYNSLSKSIKESPIYDKIQDEMYAEIPIIRSCIDFIQSYFNENHQHYRDLMHSENKIKRMLTGTCIPFSRKLFVTAQGDILPCERIGKKIICGNIDNKKVTINYKNIVDYYNNHLNDLFKTKCSTCYAILNCKVCIFNINGDENKTWDCPHYMDKENFKNFFSFFISFFEENKEDFNRIINRINLI